MALITKAHAADPGIVLLTGPSGAGKSSLLSAGLIPAVSSGAHISTPVSGGWVAARMTPGSDPMAELRRCLDQPDIKERAEGARLLIVVDQGEQLFAPDVCPQSRAEFLDVLHTMCQPSMSTPGTAVVMGLRSDALGRCVELPELADAVQSRCMVLGPMSDAELRDVVTGPAKMARLRIEAGLVDLILHDVAAENNSAQTARLPLLSHVLAGTWRQRKGGKLTVAGYKSAGGLRGSVEHDRRKRLEATRRGTTKNRAAHAVAVGHYRRRRDDSCRKEPTQELLARFPDVENAADVLETLTAARLLTIDDGDVTFTHEIVLRAWPRLAGWIDDDRANAPIRQRAETDAATWINNGRQRPFLQTGARLQATVALLDTMPTMLIHSSRSSPRRRCGVSDCCPG